MSRAGALARAPQVDPPTAEQAVSLAAVDAAMTDLPSEGIVITFADGRSMQLPPALAAVMRASVRELSAGRSITVLPTEVMLTPAETGKLLGLSRPFVARLLDEGQIPSQRLPGSRHRKVLLADVLAFAETRKRRSDGRRRIADAVADADLPY